jgi:hypothetical protein
VIKVLIVSEPRFPFPDLEIPSKSTLMGLFGLEDGRAWLEQDKVVMLGDTTLVMRLLARIVLQNLWPINHHSDMSVVVWTRQNSCISRMQWSLVFPLTFALMQSVW